MVTAEAYFWKYFESPLRYIDHYIFVSKFSQNKHLEFNDRFRGKFTQLYNFTNEEAKKDFVKGDYFLYFGRLSKEKGLGTLISTFEKLKDQKLKIAGGGPMLEIVQGSARKNSNIDYVGFKTGLELEELIRNAFFVIMPSECYENNPLSIIEAYNYGKPVIGADIAGIPELIENNRNGFLFRSGSSESLGSAVRSAAGIPEAGYIEFSEKAYDFAQEHFSVDNHYKKLMEVFNNVVDKKIS
jgi:glycosyltransferase involved in cell wall biosynthesis